MPAPRINRSAQFQRRASDALATLDSPDVQAQNLAEDMDPRNLHTIQRELGYRDQQHPRMQSVLQQEKQRLEQVHRQQLQAQEQKFLQRLQQRLNPRIGTPQDSDPQAQAQFMGQLMMQMQRRHGQAPDQRREDGTRKGAGYFGPVSRPGGGVSTELSFDFDADGRRVFAPLMVPGLSAQQLRGLVSGQDPSQETYRAASEHALQRLSQGRSPFANIREESATPLPPGFQK